MRRVITPVSLDQARDRLIDYRDKQNDRHVLYKASHLADIIWPDAEWIRSQGAGAAASRILKKLGCEWRSKEHDWGWSMGSL